MKHRFTQHPVNITDIPGNERIRSKVFDDRKGFAQGILFMIDSEAIQTELRDVAEYVFVLP